MVNPDYLKCPGSDPVSNSVPELFSCPKCNNDIEIWTDEVGGKCIECNSYFKKAQSKKNPASNSKLIDDNTKLKELIQNSYKLGATQAEIVSTKNIIIDNNLADRCREPQCENYGQSMSCPPNVSGPSGFRKQLEKFHQTIFFKIEVPSEVLFSSERREIFQLLHEVASGIEKSAIKMGFTKSKAYAGGSCKKIFCHDHSECNVISEKGTCRNPHFARPSMSGFGVNVAKIFETVGWTMSSVTHNTDSTTTKMATVCGLVLVN